MPSPEASRRNLEKAKARWRPPRPWRSLQETRVIKRLVWQWFTYCGPGKWSARAVARWLGVTHTYIQKLVREFERDPSVMQRQERLYGSATLEHLSRTREETRRQKERGWLRPPRRWKVAEFQIGDQVVRTVVPTKAEERRKAGESDVCVHGVGFATPRGVPAWVAENPPVAALCAPRQSGMLRPVRLARRWRPGMPIRP